MDDISFAMEKISLSFRQVLTIVVVVVSCSFLFFTYCHFYCCCCGCCFFLQLQQHSQAIKIYGNIDTKLLSMPFIVIAMLCRDPVKLCRHIRKEGKISSFKSCFWLLSARKHIHFSFFWWEGRGRSFVYSLILHSNLSL